jgi:dephospho-CoA kinase
MLSPLRVGLTGGIGSGKSTVAKVFEVLGIPVYYADEASKRIMHSDAELVSRIKKQFGEKAYQAGELNRAWLAEKVFNDPYQLDLLNAIVHPATIRDANTWMATQHSPYVIKEAALIFESGSSENLDYVIGVYAPASLRIQRTMERNKMTREEVLKRMSRQLDEDIKMKLCDFVIKNDEQESVIEQVIKLDAKIRNR